MTRSLRIETDLIPAGATGVVVKPIPARFVPRGIWQTPETAAAFVIERLELVTPSYCLSQGLPCGIGLLLRVRNDAPSPRAFVANLDLAIDLELVVNEAGEIAERDWARAYDRAKAVERGEIAADAPGADEVLPPPDLPPATN